MAAGGARPKASAKPRGVAAAAAAAALGSPRVLPAWGALLHVVPPLRVHARILHSERELMLLPTERLPIEGLAISASLQPMHLPIHQ